MAAHVDTPRASRLLAASNSQRNARLIPRAAGWVRSPRSTLRLAESANILFSGPYEVTAVRSRPQCDSGDSCRVSLLNQIFMPRYETTESHDPLTPLRPATWGEALDRIAAAIERTQQR